MADKQDFTDKITEGMKEMGKEARKQLGGQKDSTSA